MTETESEEHFLKYCVAYKDIRQEFMNGLENKEDEENNTKILFGVGKIEDIDKGIRYIRRAMARRYRILKLN